jgi:para-nitrobenzyl esterase
MKFNYIFIFIFCCISSNVFSNEYEVNSDSGHTFGYLKNNVIHWDDIPYAKPPVGDLRWRAPRKLDEGAKKYYYTKRK